MESVPQEWPVAIRATPGDNDRDMKMHHLDISIERIEAFCGKWKVRGMWLFGSVLREDFRPDSDVDLMVTFAEDSHWGLMDLIAMEDELASIFGRRVDLVTRRSVQESPNYIRRNHILAHSEVLHVAG